MSGPATTRRIDLGALGGARLCEIFRSLYSISFARRRSTFLERLQARALDKGSRQADAAGEAPPSLSATDLMVAHLRPFETVLEVPGTAFSAVAPSFLD